MTYRAVIFDLDGTLLDSRADLADSMNCVLEAAGMFAVGVLWRFRTKEELRAHGAAALIEQPSELLELL